MRFFTMEQDRTLPDIIQFRDFDISGPRHIFYKEDAQNIDDSVTVYLAKDSGETAPDFIQSPVHMVSDRVGKVLDMYEEGMVFRSIAITGKEQGTLFIYRHLLPERLDMVSGKTQFYPNGSVKRLVLDAGRIGEHKVFMLNDKRFVNPYVSLEVVESLLRRGVRGMIFREVEVEE